MSRKALAIAFFATLLPVLLGRPASATVGALVKTVSVPPAAQCTVGTSVAAVPGALVGFPAKPVLLVISCYGGNTLNYIDPVTSTLVKSVNTSVTPGNGWGSLAFRGDKLDLTGCGNDAATHPVYSIDPNTGAATFLFNSVAGGFEICDGHTWDGKTQTFYISPDVSTTVYHYSAAGALLGSFPAAAGCPNSGVAVGGDVLYEACNGILNIVRTDKTNGLMLSSFPSAGSRTEDLECDSVTFFESQGVHVMWSKDAFLNELFAFEIPLNDCGPGGFPPIIEVPVDIHPTSCPNPINCKSKGVVPAAVLGTASFDVTRIDPASIRILGVAPLRWALEDVATPYVPFTGKSSCTDCTTAGPDGFLDLTLKFDTQALLQAIGTFVGKSCRVLTLTGKLKPQFGGNSFSGEDVVRLQCP